MNSALNYYELLGVSENATKEEIKKAYKTQMKKWHPDINKSKEAPEMSIKLNEAKETLLDDDKRNAYDLSLKKEVNDNYNKFNRSQKSNEDTYTNYDYTTHTVYEEARKVTKWEYFKEYLKFSSDSNFRKLLAIIGVGLETFLCFIIKMSLIFFAVISNFCSYLIMMTFSLLAPILGLLLLIVIGTILTRGFFEALTDSTIIQGALIFGSLYVLMLVLPILSRKIISPKVFDILYNKIDINLFKICVGYGKNA